MITTHIDNTSYTDTPNNGRVAITCMITRERESRTSNTRVDLQYIRMQHVYMYVVSMIMDWITPMTCIRENATRIIIVTMIPIIDRAPTSALEVVRAFSFSTPMLVLHDRCRYTRIVQR